VAVLKVDARDLPAITICDSDKLEVGDIVLAIGNPFGVGQTVTKGIVSARGRTSLGINEYEDFIQTDAAINQGNSGGALVDAQGRLAGINTVIFSGSGGFQGVGFAVPSNLARSVMERLIKFGRVTRGYIGVELQPEITSDMAEKYNLPDRNGAMIRRIGPNTPAATNGLQIGDVIREVDGKKIGDRPQLRLAISETAPGSKVTLAILRVEQGKKPVAKTVTLTLGEMPEQAASNRPRMEQGDDNESDQDALDGVEVTDLNPDVRRQYGIPRNVHGALVSSVDEDSNSAKAGLRQGDVVLEINHEPVRNADGAVELSKNASGNRVLLRVWRDGGSLPITVDNRKQR
jgi:serine protease Do